MIVIDILSYIEQSLQLIFVSVLVMIVIGYYFIIFDAIITLLIVRF